MKNLKKISLALMCLFVWSNFASAGKQAYTSSGQKGGAKTAVVSKKGGAKKQVAVDDQLAQQEADQLAQQEADRITAVEIKANNAVTVASSALSDLFKATSITEVQRLEAVVKQALVDAQEAQGVVSNATIENALTTVQIAATKATAYATAYTFANKGATDAENAANDSGTATALAAVDTLLSIAQTGLANAKEALLTMSDSVSLQGFVNRAQKAVDTLKTKRGDLLKKETQLVNDLMTAYDDFISNYKQQLLSIGEKIMNWKSAILGKSSLTVSEVMQLGNNMRVYRDTALELKSLPAVLNNLVEKFSTEKKNNLKVNFYTFNSKLSDQLQSIRDGITGWLDYLQYAKGGVPLNRDQIVSFTRTILDWYNSNIPYTSTALENQVRAAIKN